MISDIYVDDLRKRHKVNGHLMGVWSHMFAHPPDHDRLVAFAGEIELDSRHIQHPHTDKEHFDVTESKRLLAIAAGAKPVTVKEGARLRKAWRDRFKQHPDRTGADQ